MSVFDFISGDDFRASLEQDYIELDACVDAGAWKAVHVLSGALIEAILIDYLIASGYQKKTKKDPLKLPLNHAIDACEVDGILSEKTAQLSHALRSYRNLIHPGRKLRLGEDIDENGARVARALVDIIIKSIATAKQETLGYTAEQLTTKLLHDASALPIFEDLIKSSSEIEIEHLLLKVLPATYFDLANSEFYSDENDLETLKTLSAAFHVAFDSAPDRLKKLAMREFVSILKEDSQYKVFTYETQFFKSEYLELLDAKSIGLIKKHLLARLDDKQASGELLSSVGALSKYLTSAEVGPFVDSILRRVAYKKPDHSAQANAYILEAVAHANPKVQDQIERRLDSWIEHLEDQNRPDRLNALNETKTSMRVVRELGDLF